MAAMFHPKAAPNAHSAVDAAASRAPQLRSWPHMAMAERRLRVLGAGVSQPTLA